MCKKSELSAFTLRNSQLSVVSFDAKETWICESKLWFKMYTKKGKERKWKNNRLEKKNYYTRNFCNDKSFKIAPNMKHETVP